MTILLALLSSGCASFGPQNLAKINGTESLENIQTKFGEPDSVIHESDGETLIYLWCKVSRPFQKCAQETYGIFVANNKALLWGPYSQVRATIQRLKAEAFVSATPLEVCQKNKEWKRYGTLSECKSEIRGKQQQVRSELFEADEQVNVERESQQQAIRNMAIQGLVNQTLRNLSAPSH